MAAKFYGLSSVFAGLSLVLACSGAAAQTVPQAIPAASGSLTYADLADLSEAADVVLKARVVGMVRVADERAPGLKPGFGRYLMASETQALLSGRTPIGESVRYLADLPLDARGKPARLKKQSVLLFAKTVPGKPGSLQLLSPASQQVWSDPLEQRVRQILTALASPTAPARVLGVREILYVPGALAGQGETQAFLSTQDGSAASITVHHEPGVPPVWGVSFSELVADLGHPPQRETLEWYRLACFLPNALPEGANVSHGYAASRQAESDYRMVLGELGVCNRTQ